MPPPSIPPEPAGGAPSPSSYRSSLPGRSGARHGGSSVPALDASLSPSSSSARFDRARAAATASISAVAEVAAHRLIFLDSRHSLYQVLVLADRAQPVAAREVMRASFEAFLMVLLAGGNERSFARADHAAVEEDLRSLKRAFCTCGEGLVPEDVVAREAGTAEAVVDLMARSTECLIDAFAAAASESGGGEGGGGGTPLPPTTRKWEPADPNTILRVLCHRDDEAANQFLKRTFQLARRR